MDGHFSAKDPSRSNFLTEKSDNSYTTFDSGDVLELPRAMFARVVLKC